MFLLANSFYSGTEYCLCKYLGLNLIEVETLGPLNKDARLLPSIDVGRQISVESGDLETLGFFSGPNYFCCCAAF